MDDWAYPTRSDVHGTLPAQPALVEEDWRVAEARRIRAELAEAARIAEVEHVQSLATWPDDSAAAPPLFGVRPASMFAF